MGKKKKDNILKILKILAILGLLAVLFYIFYYTVNTRNEIVLQDEVSQEQYYEGLKIDSTAVYKEIKKAPIYTIDTFKKQEKEYIINEKNTFIYDKKVPFQKEDSVLYVKNNKNEIIEAYKVKNIKTDYLTIEDSLTLIKKAKNNSTIKYLTLMGDYVVGLSEETYKERVTNNINPRNYFVQVGSKKIYPKDSKIPVRYFELEEGIYIDFVVIGQYYTEEEKSVLEQYKNELRTIIDPEVKKLYIATYQKKYPKLFP